MKKIRKALELSGKTFMILPIQKKVKIAILGIDGKTITNPKNSAENFNNFFYFYWKKASKQHLFLQKCTTEII